MERCREQIKGLGMNNVGKNQKGEKKRRDTYKNCQAPITKQIQGAKKRGMWDTEMASRFLPRELGI